MKGKGLGRGEEVEAVIWSTQQFWRGSPMTQNLGNTSNLDRIINNLDNNNSHIYLFCNI